MSSDSQESYDGKYIRNMRELYDSPYIGSRKARRERFKSSEHTTQKKTKDQIRKARKRQRKNRRTT